MQALRCALITTVLLGCGSSLTAADVTELTMRTRANVRFGPSTDAPVVTTLDGGAVVEVLGKAPGRDDWYQIRFPRQGNAWMHEVVLASTEDPRVLRVKEERASVRADARIKGQLVDQLDIGDTVEWVGFEVDGQWRGRKVGGWYAVYPTSSVAYVHRSVLNLGGGHQAGGAVAAAPEHDAPIQRRAQASGAIEELWQRSRTTYQAHREQLQRDPESAIDQDWHALARDLAKVVEEHPTFRTRLMAKKMYAGIQHLLAAVQRAREQRGLPAVAGLPDVADPSPRRAEPAAREPVPEPRVARREPTPEANPRREPEPSRPALAEPESAASPAIALPDAGGNEGWLVQKDVQGSVGSHVLIDENSEASAVILEDPDSGIQLSEFFWRRVAVTGTREAAEVTIDGRTRTLPVITAEDVRLVH